ncbi:MAG TPA: outer membrane protein transport protein [Myxococcales bacterium]|jgi:long-chain fatty acid transport protein|nr:outer membrane protein transport protein [Myxococcales bacterium]
MRYLIAAMLLAPAAAFAGGYAIPNENPRDLALAQGNVAAQNGPEAAHANPAALAGQKGLAITADVEMLYNMTAWSDPTLGSASLKKHAVFPPQFSASYGNALPNGMPYGLGFSLMLPGGGALPWPTNWPGAGRIQDVDQKVWLTQFSTGIQLHPMFKLGASLLYYRVQEKLGLALPFISSQGSAQLGVAGGAFSYEVSGEFHAPNGIPLTIAVDYKHQAPLTLEGNAHFTNVPPNLTTSLQDQAATEHVTVPNILYVGAAYDLNDNLKLMGSWNLERWKSYVSDTYVGDKGLLISVPRDYNNAWIYRFGAEYTKPAFLPPLTLRAGLLRSISEQPTNTISPTLTDGNSWAISVGAGYEFGSGLRADIGYQYAFFDTVTATGTEAFPGSYDTHVHLLSAGLTWRTTKF